MEDNTLHDILLLLLVSLIVVFIFAPPLTNNGNSKIINTPVFRMSLPDIFYKYMFGSTAPEYSITNFGNTYDNFMQ